VEKKFDVTLKSLLEDSPEDWPILAGVSERKVEVIDADVATISGAADKVLRLPGPPPWLMHFEFQAGPDASLPCRTNVYNAALEARHDLPVSSVVVLLRRQANLSVLTGVYERRTPRAPQPYRIFHYQVIRVWELPVQSLLQGGLGRLALAPVSAVNEADLPGVLREMKQRVARVRDRGRLGRWWTAVYVLMGMRYQDDVVEQLLQGVLGMEESTTYQAIVRKGLAQGRAEGALQEARKMLLRLGQTHFQTPPSTEIQARVTAMQDLEPLEQLLLQVTQVQSWDELLPTAAKPQRRKSSRR
jgi:predicted transposase YdaD